MLGDGDTGEGLSDRRSGGSNVIIWVGRFPSMNKTDSITINDISQVEHGIIIG